MILLVHKALATLDTYDLPNVGRLLSPRQYSRAADTAESGRPWAADNDAFLAWDLDRYSMMLERIAGLSGCLFVTAPDVVGDNVATDQLWKIWSHVIHQTGLPAAYVAQDGARFDRVPWTGIDALFVGGTTDWKMGDDARWIVDEAKQRELWVHMGRVNSWQRLKYAMSIGVDSIDGTSLSRFTDRWLPIFSEMASAPRQGRLP